MLAAASGPKHPDHVEATQWLDDYDSNGINELPIKYALGRIASQRKRRKGSSPKEKEEDGINQLIVHIHQPRGRAIRKSNRGGSRLSERIR